MDFLIELLEILVELWVDYVLAFFYFRHINRFLNQFLEPFKLSKNLLDSFRIAN